jgi:hypothetical protein
VLGAGRAGIGRFEASPIFPQHFVKAALGQDEICMEEGNENANVIATSLNLLFGFLFCSFKRNGLCESRYGLSR